MDDTLRIIRHLYGEDVDDPSLARRLAEDEALRREYERLRETKERLDRRAPSRPDPAVVDQVVDAARTAAQESNRSSSSSPTPADDRSARPPSRTWSRRLQAASAALALLLAIGVGWWQRPGLIDESTSTGGEVTSQQASPISSVEGAGADTNAVPAWDDSGELIRIHRGIERLQARSRSDPWGGLQTVGQTRP